MSVCPVAVWQRWPATNFTYYLLIWHARFVVVVVVVVSSCRKRNCFIMARTLSKAFRRRDVDVDVPVSGSSPFPFLPPPYSSACHLPPLPFPHSVRSLGYVSPVSPLPHQARLSHSTMSLVESLAWCLTHTMLLLLLLLLWSLLDWPTIGQSYEWKLMARVGCQLPVSYTERNQEIYEEICTDLCTLAIYRVSN